MEAERATTFLGDGGSGRGLRRRAGAASNRAGGLSGDAAAAAAAGDVGDGLHDSAGANDLHRGDLGRGGGLVEDRGRGGRRDDLLGRHRGTTTTAAWGVGISEEKTEALQGWMHSLLQHPSDEVVQQTCPASQPYEPLSAGGGGDGLEKTSCGSLQ